MKKNFKELINYTLPAVLENILQTTVGFVNSVLIAKISLVAVSAVSLVNGVMAVYQAVFIALAVAVITVVSSITGEKQTEKRSETVRTAIVLSLVVGGVFSVMSLLFAHPILVALGAKGAVLSQGIIFLRVVAGTSILMVLMIVLGQLVRSAGRPKLPLSIERRGIEAGAEGGAQPLLLPAQLLGELALGDARAVHRGDV